MAAEEGVEPESLLDAMMEVFRHELVGRVAAADYEGNRSGYDALEDEWPAVFVRWFSPSLPWDVLIDTRFSETPLHLPIIPKSVTG